MNTNLPSPSKSGEDSESSCSSSTTKSEKSSKEQIHSQSFERKSPSVANDYDEDFSDVSHSRATPQKEPLQRPKTDDIDVESIQEDFEDKKSLHGTSQSSTSKSSGDEQSEILVLVKKSANSTPRRQDDKTPEAEQIELFLPSPSLPPPATIVQPKTEPNNNDDTCHDVSDDETNERIEQEEKIDKLTESFLQTFIDEAIDQRKQLERLKKEKNQKMNSLTQEAKEWVSDDDSTDEEVSKQEINDEPVKVFYSFSLFFVIKIFFRVPSHLILVDSMTKVVSWALH